MPRPWSSPGRRYERIREETISTVSTMAMTTTIPAAACGYALGVPKAPSLILASMYWPSPPTPITPSPMAIRVLISWTLYVLEINTRIAISLGVVGAGGIGQYISLNVQQFNYGKAATGILMVIMIVISVELISSRLRARLRPGENSGKGFVEAIKDLGDGGKWMGTGS